VSKKKKEKREQRTAWTGGESSYDAGKKIEKRLYCTTSCAGFWGVVGLSGGVGGSQGDFSDFFG